MRTSPSVLGGLPANCDGAAAHLDDSSSASVIVVGVWYHHHPLRYSSVTPAKSVDVSNRQVVSLRQGSLGWSFSTSLIVANLFLSLQARRDTSNTASTASKNGTVQSSMARCLVTTQSRDVPPESVPRQSPAILVALLNERMDLRTGDTPENGALHHAQCSCLGSEIIWCLFPAVQGQEKGKDLFRSMRAAAAGIDQRPFSAASNLACAASLVPSQTVP